MHIVELEPGVWLADVEGDPGRTVVRENAMGFTGLRKAHDALMAARAFNRYSNARIIQVPGEWCAHCGAGNYARGYAHLDGCQKGKENAATLTSAAV